MPFPLSDLIPLAREAHARGLRERADADALAAASLRDAMRALAIKLVVDLGVSPEDVTLTLEHVESDGDECWAIATVGSLRFVVNNWDGQWIKLYSECLHHPLAHSTSGQAIATLEDLGMAIAADERGDRSCWGCTRERIHVQAKEPGAIVVAHPNTLDRGLEVMAKARVDLPFRK